MFLLALIGRVHSILIGLFKKFETRGKTPSATRVIGFFFTVAILFFYNYGTVLFLIRISPRVRVLIGSHWPRFRYFNWSFFKS